MEVTLNGVTYTNIIDMLKIDRNMTDAVDYAAFEFDRISNIEVSLSDNYYTVNLELKFHSTEQLEEINRILEYWNGNKSTRI